jgi:hypothetical protein
MNEYKYLSFVEQAPKTKTKVFEVKNKVFGDVLGYVKWYAPWRKYCFYVDSDLVFDAGCLWDIQDFMNKLMAERRENNGKVLSSDNIDLHHCGNCAYINYFKGVADFDGCSTMKRFGIPPEETKVNCGRGLCDIWRKKKGEKKI